MGLRRRWTWGSSIVLRMATEFSREYLLDHPRLARVTLLELLGMCRRGGRVNIVDAWLESETDERALGRSKRRTCLGILARIVCIIRVKKTVRSRPAISQPHNGMLSKNREHWVG